MMYLFARVTPPTPPPPPVNSATPGLARPGPAPPPRAVARGPPCVEAAVWLPPIPPRLACAVARTGGPPESTTRFERRRDQSVVDSRSQVVGTRKPVRHDRTPRRPERRQSSDGEKSRPTDRARCPRTIDQRTGQNALLFFRGVHYSRTNDH